MNEVTMNLHPCQHYPLSVLEIEAVVRGRGIVRRPLAVLVLSCKKKWRLPSKDFLLFAAASK